MSYPINLLRYSLEHKGGTKAYHIYLLINSEGKSVLVTRWGKVGVFGDIQVKHYDGRLKGRNAAETKLRAKRSGGYREVELREETYRSFSELLAGLGALASKMGAAPFEHLDPSANTLGMRREADPPRLDEDLRLTGKDRRSADISKDIEAQRNAEEEKARAVLQANPLFGMF